MKMFWKLLGAAALVAGLTPYQVETNDETGEKTYHALLWQATKTSQDGEKDSLDISFGFRMPNAQDDEPHLFSDELCVEYTGTPVTETSSPEDPIVRDATAEAEEVVETSEPAEAEVLSGEIIEAETAESVEVIPAEEAPAEENKEKA